MNRLSKTPDSFLTGNLLVASPKLIGHPYSQSVVLLTSHSTATGAAGVVLNSQANEAARAWCRNLATLEDKDVALQQLKEVANSDLTSGDQAVPVTLCVAKPAKTLEEVVDQLGTGVRLLVGRITWEAGALEHELAQGAWMFCPAFPQFIFGEHENLWRATLQCIGNSVIASAPGLKFPQNVEWN